MIRQQVRTTHIKKKTVVASSSIAEQLHSLWHLLTMSMLPLGVAPPGLMTDASGGRHPRAVVRKPVEPHVAVLMFAVFVGLGALVAGAVTSHESLCKFHDGPHLMPTRLTIHQNYFDSAKQRTRPMYKPPSRWVFLGWIVLHAVSGFGGYLCWVRHGFVSKPGRDAAMAHLASVVLHATWVHFLFVHRALWLSVWLGRISTGVLFLAVVVLGKARFESGAMHVPLAFATWKLAEFTVNVAAAN